MSRMPVTNYKCSTTVLPEATNFAFYGWSMDKRWFMLRIFLPLK